MYNVLCSLFYANKKLYFPFLFCYHVSYIHVKAKMQQLCNITYAILSTNHFG